MLIGGNLSGPTTSQSFTLRFLDLKFSERARAQIKPSEEELAACPLNGDEALALFRALDQTLNRDTSRLYNTIDLHITTKMLPPLNELGFFGHIGWLLQSALPESFNIPGKKPIPKHSIKILTCVTLSLYSTRSPCKD